MNPIVVPTKSGTPILIRSLTHLIPLEVKTSEAGTEPDSSKCSSSRTVRL